MSDTKRHDNIARVVLQSTLLWSPDGGLVSVVSEDVFVQSTVLNASIFYASSADEFTSEPRQMP